MGPIISVFVMVLVISILAGLTFLFVSSLKTQVRTSVIESITVINQTGGTITSTPYRLTADSYAVDFAVTRATNATSGLPIAVGNYTLSTDGYVTNASATQWSTVLFSYTYRSPSGTNAYIAVNGTESAGATIVNYLPLIFLAVIFGALLTLVLRIILPYINLGNSVGGF